MSPCLSLTNNLLIITTGCFQSDVLCREILLEMQSKHGEDEYRELVEPESLYVLPAPFCERRLKL